MRRRKEKRRKMKSCRRRGRRKGWMRRLKKFECESKRRRRGAQSGSGVRRWGGDYSVHCTLYTVHCTLYTVHCKLYTVQCTLYSVHCTLFTSVVGEEVGKGLIACQLSTLCTLLHYNTIALYHYWTIALFHYCTIALVHWVQCWTLQSSHYCMLQCSFYSRLFNYWTVSCIEQGSIFTIVLCSVDTTTLYDVNTISWGMQWYVPVHVTTFSHFETITLLYWWVLKSAVITKLNLTSVHITKI